MKSILVPCDFSATAKEAIRFANEIAVKGTSHITLLHSIELPSVSKASAVMSFEQNYMKDMKEKAVGELKKLGDKWIDSDVKTSFRIEFGGFLPSLKKVVKSQSIDLVVMGTTGASGIKEFTVGSNAEKVVRSSEVPVITLRKSIKAVKNIVFPTYPDMDQEELTMRVKGLQNFFGARLHVLFVNTPAYFRKDLDTKTALEKFARRFMLKNFTVNIYNDTSEEEGIINFADALGADMVAMRTHGRKGFSHLAVSSIAEDVLNHIACPVWTYKVR